MPGIIMFTMIVVIVVIVVLFLHDTRQHRQTPPSDPPPRRQPERVRPPQPPPERPKPEDVDVDGLAEHVRELRRAIDEGLIGREEAVASIVRQAEGKVGEGAAQQLLDTAELE